MSNVNGSILQAVIIGGGAAGLTAAVIAARKGVRVTILEGDDRPAKKLLRTGSGRCNLTNEGVRASGAEAGTDRRGNARKPLKERYFGSDPAFAETVIRSFDFEETSEFFRSIGITFREFDGWYYPFNEEAQAVKAALCEELARLPVRVRTGTAVRSISRRPDGLFAVETDGWVYSAEAVLLAAGSRASLPELTPDPCLLAEGLGHTVVPTHPALTSLYTPDRKIAQLWAGVRARAEMRLMIDGAECGREAGQIQFTAKGISGIPVMNLSAAAVDALERGRAVEALLDLNPGGIDLDPRFALPSKLQKALSSCRKDVSPVIRIPVSGYGAFSEAQAASGGVRTDEFDPSDMSSKLCRGFYCAGEILDLVGECGGYNLQFAWSSGAAAGRGLASYFSML